MGTGGMGGMWPFWLLLAVGLVMLAVVAALALSGRVGGGSSGGAPPTSARGRAREVLDERYARGEITTEEYRERLRVLEDGGR